MSRKEKQNR